MKTILTELGINIAISVAGLFGALLMVGKQDIKNWKTTLFSILGGTACANYITPIILDLSEIDVKYQVSVGFVLGFLGLKSVEIISKKLLKTADDGSNT